MQFFGIVGLTVAAAVLFGTLEYAANALFVRAGLESAVSVSLWAAAGVVLGVPLAMAARLGARPTRSAGSLVRPVVLLFAAAAGFAAAAAVVGATLAKSGHLMLPAEVREQVAAEKWPAVQAGALAKQAAYNVAFVGGGMLVGWAWVSRKHGRGRR
ncbi:MAG: hypothetical protein MUF18_08530 [Fimbriiglobus sp.]|jgi:hypothetical protein|nr:hypothetical protein [Fimbriiglobus sp.]